MLAVGSREREGSEYAGQRGRGLLRSTGLSLVYTLALGVALAIAGSLMRRNQKSTLLHPTQPLAADYSADGSK